MSECTCGKPTRDDAYVCEDCLTALAKALGNMTWLDEQLEVTLTKQRATPTEGDPPTVSRNLPLPYHPHAANALHHLRATLVSWVRFCQDKQVRSRGEHIEDPANTLPAMSRWLLWHVDGLGLHDLGPTAVDEIIEAEARAMRVIDRPAERKYVGPCECGRDLYAKPGAKEATCVGCEGVYQVAEYDEWMQERIKDHLVTAKEGSALLGRFGLETKRDTIDKWHKRGLVVSKGHSAEGHRLYVLNDLISVASRHAVAVEV